MAINLAGYAGDDPNLRLGKRIKLLSDAFPEFSTKVDLLTQLAKSDLEDGELLRQTGDLAGLQAFASTKQTLEAQSKRSQREIFRKLPAITQVSLKKIGYDVPSNDYNETSLQFHGIDLGWKKRSGILGALTNLVETPAMLSAVAVHKVRQAGGLFTEAQNLGIGTVQHAYRALGGWESARPDDFTATLPPGASEAEKVAARQQAAQKQAVFSGQMEQARVAEATYWLDQNVKQGNLSQVDAARIAAKGSDAVLKWYAEADDKNYVKGMDRLRAYSGSWGDAWKGTGNPKASFRAESILKAREYLDNDFGKANLAERIAAGEKPEALLAERGIIIGTNEYRSELAKLQDEINSDEVKNAVTILKSGVMNWGADTARASGLKEGTPAFLLASGVFDVAYTFALDPTIPAGKAIKAVRAARYGIEAANVYGEMSRVRTVIEAGEDIYKNTDGTRKTGLALLAARDELTRAQSVNRAITRVVDAWNEGGRSFYELLNEQPQLAPLISFARKAVTEGPDGTITTNALWDALQTDAGVATILQGSPRMYRKAAGMAALPRIDMFNQASGEVRGLLGKGIDIFNDYRISGKALSAEAITSKFGTGLLAQNSAAAAGALEHVLAYVPTRVAQFAKLGIKAPYRNYVNLEDMSSIKEMLNLGSLVGIDSAEQARVLDNLIKGRDEFGGIVDQATSLATARGVVTSYLSSIFQNLGIPQFAAKEATEVTGFGKSRQWDWANNLMEQFGKAYDVKGDQLAYLASHGSNNIRIPQLGQLARAAQNNMILGATFRFMNPWWVESAMTRWRQLVTIAPRMGLRAGVEEALTFMLREGPNKYAQALRASSIYAPERISTLERLANEAGKAGDIARKESLLAEAEHLRRMPGLRAIAGGVDWLAQQTRKRLPVAAGPVDFLNEFTQALTESTSSFFRKGLAAVAPISDEHIKLGAELWARDESVMALASVVDGRHTTIEAPFLDPFGSISEVMDSGFNPIDVSLTGGKGFRLLETSTDDLIQSMNRMAQMTQHARDPFVVDVMQKMAGAHTQLEREAIFAGFASPGKKGKDFRRLFRIPASVPEDEKFDWAINRFREVVAEVHPDVRDDLIKGLRSELKNPGELSQLLEAQKTAEDAGNFQLGQDFGRQIAALRESGGTQQDTLLGMVSNKINKGLDDLAPHAEAWKNFQQVNQGYTAQAKASLIDAIKSRDASKATSKAGKTLASKVIADLNSGSPTQATLDFVGALTRRPNARKALDKAYAEWQVWDRSAKNFRGITKLTENMGLRAKELLTYDGPLTHIAGSGPEAINGWFKSEVLTSAAKNGLYNNQELAANMDRMVRVPYTNSQGQKMIGSVARPLAENHIGIYWPTVDETVANSLYGTLNEVENLVKQGKTQEDAIAEVISKMMFAKADGTMAVANSRQRYLMGKILETTSRDGLWAYMQEAKTSGRAAMPFANLTYANHDIADEISRTLHSGLLGKWVNEGDSVLGTVDIATPKGIIQHPNWKPGGLLNKNFLPADSEVGTLPSRLSGSNVYATPDHLLFRGQPITPATATKLPGGVLRAQFSREDAINSFAEQIAQATVDRFVSPHTGGILHEVIHGILRDESDLYQRVSNLTSRDLPTQSLVPNIYLMLKEGEKPSVSKFLNKLADVGYSKTVSPLIAGISRQPMFIASLGEAATVARDWRKSLMALSTQEQGIAAMFASRGVPFEDVVKAWDSLGTFETRPGTSLKKMMSVFAENGIHLTDETEAKAVRDTLSYLTHVDRLEKNIAYERAFNNILPYIDDHNIKSFASTYMKGFVPFMYAEEQFMRRWLRTLIDNPFALHRAQMYLGAMRSIGIVQKDEQTGQYVFHYPAPPAVWEFLGKFPVIGDVFFGGSGRVPNGLELNGMVSESLPGFKNPGQIMPGPLFTVGMTALRHFGGQSEAIADDMIESATGRRPNPKTDVQDLLLGMLPGYASRAVKAWLPGVDSSEELARTSIQAAMMLGAEGMAYKRKANDAKAAGDMTKYQTYEAKAAALLPPTGAEKDFEAATDRYKHMVAASARKMMFMRGATGFLGFGTSYLQGEQYEMSQEFNNYLKAIDPTDPDGYAKALGKFLARYPDALPYTVKGSVSVSKAPVPMTGGTNDWMRQNDAILQETPLGASWLIPPDVEGERDPRVWARLRALDIYKQRKTDDWIVEYNMAASGSDYFSSKNKFDEAIAMLGDNSDAKQVLRASWAKWKDEFMKANPTFQRELESASGRQRRSDVVDQILRIADGGKAPTDEYSQSIISMAKSYASYQEGLKQIVGNTKAMSELRDAYRLSFWKYGASQINSDLALAGFWNGVIAPDAFPDNYNPYGMGN